MFLLNPRILLGPLEGLSRHRLFPNKADTQRLRFSKSEERVWFRMKAWAVFLTAPFTRCDEYPQKQRGQVRDGWAGRRPDIFGSQPLFGMDLVKGPRYYRGRGDRVTIALEIAALGAPAW